MLYGSKKPGKTEFFGRRRISTRISGFQSHPNFTGGEYKSHAVESIILESEQEIVIGFTIPASQGTSWIGFGGWFQVPESSDIVLRCTDNGNNHKYFCEKGSNSGWSKFGGMWRDESNLERNFELSIVANEQCEVGLFELNCGLILHDHLDNARENLLGNMHLYSPEANFYTRDGEVHVVSDSNLEGATLTMHLKGCNRCGRYLPINLPDERHHLSFTNHCTAAHRIPCKHAGFGRLRDTTDPNRTLHLRYGFQLECRFCKKFEVNAAHNPQRSAAQMKEDATRRRSFEVLLEELFGESPTLRYRNKYGSELADDVFKRFGGRCFRCQKILSSRRSMHLDHTRPLALLWPIDETATALCGSCNSSKRDRSPSQFYSDTQLSQLAAITGLSEEELRSDHPNVVAIDLLRGRLDWFENDFLQRDELQRVQEGKRAADLLLKALEKVIAKYPGGVPPDLDNFLNTDR